MSLEKLTAGERLERMPQVFFVLRSIGAVSRGCRKYALELFCASLCVSTGIIFVADERGLFHRAPEKQEAADPHSSPQKIVLDHDPARFSHTFLQGYSDGIFRPARAVGREDAEQY